MPAAVAIPAAISAGTSIVGGVLGSRAAGKAADLQYKASQQGIQQLRDILAQYNPQIGAAGETAATGVESAAAQGRQDILGTVGTGTTGISDATKQAIGLLQPYIGAGGEALTNLRDLMAPGGEFSRPFTAADMQAYDPGYSFRMEQASKALQGSAAARGAALGGGTLGALTGLNQNLASSEFGAAQERFRQGQADRFNRLNTLVNLGATTAGTAGGYGMTGATSIADLLRASGVDLSNLAMRGAGMAGDYRTTAVGRQAQNAFDTQRMITDLLTGGAAAQGAGAVGSANAWTGALTGVAGAAGGVGKYYQDKETFDRLSELMNPLGPTGYIRGPIR
jgi:hypothetical protein